MNRNRHKTPDRNRHQTPGRNLRLGFGLLGVVGLAMVMVAGCGGSDDDDLTMASSSSADSTQTTRSDQSSSRSSSSTSSTSDPSSASADDTPDDATDDSTDDKGAAGPVRMQLDWWLSILNDGGEMSVEDIEERFSPAFLNQVPAEQIAAFTPQLFTLAAPPFTVESFEPAGTGLSAAVTLLGADDRRLSVEIAVASVTPHLIEGLLVAPAELEFPGPITVEAIDARLAAVGSRSSLGVYDLSDGRCTAVHEIRTDSTIVLGSVFKLWVLAALAVEIDEGRASWDETMAVTDELRSTPDGDIYELETGTEVSLQGLAEVMISISDNTATDMLLDRVGRSAVEQAMERIGVADPSVNVPMLSTGNLFALKFVADPPNAADYRTLDEAERRSLLEELDRTALPWVTSEASLAELGESVNADGLPIGVPRDFDIEWFASADDLCRTFVHLNDLAETPGLEPVASILEINAGAGIPFDRDRWPTIRFKGGSEPGVVAGAWWFEGPDGDRYVVAGGVANPDSALDELNAVLTLASAIELID